MDTLFSTFSPSNLGQSGYPRTVLKSAHHEDSKTPPTCLIGEVLAEIFKVEDKAQFPKERVIEEKSSLITLITQPQLCQIKNVGGVLKSSWQANTKKYTIFKSFPFPSNFVKFSLEMTHLKRNLEPSGANISKHDLTIGLAMENYPKMTLTCWNLSTGSKDTVKFTFKSAVLYSHSWFDLNIGLA